MQDMRNFLKNEAFFKKEDITALLQLQLGKSTNLNNNPRISFDQGPILPFNSLAF